MHGGWSRHFHRVFRPALRRLVGQLRRLMAERTAEEPLVIVATGHSLGGVMAQLAAHYVGLQLQAQKERRVKVFAVVFGSPTVRFLQWRALEVVIVIVAVVVEVAAVVAVMLLLLLLLLLLSLLLLLLLSLLLLLMLLLRLLLLLLVLLLLLLMVLLLLFLLLLRLLSSLLLLLML